MRGPATLPCPPLPSPIAHVVTPETPLHPPPRAATGQSRARRRRGHLARRRRGGRDGILALGQRARVRLPPAAGGLSRSLERRLSGSQLVHPRAQRRRRLAGRGLRRGRAGSGQSAAGAAAPPARPGPGRAAPGRGGGARPGMGCARENGWPGAATPRTPRPDTAPARRPPTREQARSSPCFRSARISSGVSSPTDKRSSPSDKP